MGTNPDGDPAPYILKRSYASIIEMMIYLASNSRPEIQFSIHQCDCFTQNYRASHEDTIIRTRLYLEDTQNKGLILSPTRKLCVNCYVDYDFTGLFYYEDLHNPVCERSRSGYVVTFSNYTTLWISKIHTDISLSTLHAKYVALSQSLRDLLPFEDISKETFKILGFNTKKLKMVNQSSVFEDNAGAIVVPSSHRLNPTSELISFKYYWCCHHIDSDNNVSKPIYIEKIDGKVNPEDIFTKIKSKKSEFLALRKLLCG